MTPDDSLLIPPVTRRPFFLDNGFLNVVFNKNGIEDRFTNILRTADPDAIDLLKSRPDSFLTAFTLIEWTGVPMQPVQFSADEEKEFIRLANRFEFSQLYESLKAGFARFDVLGHPSLSKLAAEKRSRIHSSKLGLWDQLVGRALEHPEDVDWVHEALAFDRMTNYNRASIEYQSRVTRFGFFSPFSHIRNASKFRMCKHLWDSADKQVQDQFPVIKENIGKFKPFRDYADSDLIHLAVLGVEASGLDRAPLTCFTCDIPDQVEARVSLYLGFVDHVFRHYDPTLNGYLFTESVRRFNGVVHCFQFDGTYTRRIDVGSRDMVRFL